MKRKLIEILPQEHLIVCDYCEFKIPNKTGDPNEDISMYINVGCPLCGENLLTENDYNGALKTMKAIEWLNKWFSWIAYFYPNTNKTNASVHYHNGIKIETKKS